jgi:translocator protein
MDTHPKWKNSAALAVFIAITFISPAIGSLTPPGGWYAALVKPSWNPPSWVFGPVWTLLYIMMAMAAWLVWRCGRQRRALFYYAVQLALNAAWTPIFFGLKMPGFAFAVIIALLASIIVTTRAFGRVLPLAGLLLVPYAAWVAFAACLNFTLWRLNP